MPKAQSPKKLRDFAYLIFDLDGTMAESLAMWQKIDERFLARRGQLCDEAYLQAVRVKRLYEAAVYTIERYLLPEHPDEIIQEWMDMALDQYRHHIDMRPGVIPFLAWQKELGKKLAICTASPRVFVEAILQRYDLMPLFDVIVCANEHLTGKDQAEIWQFTAQALQAEVTDCVVFEDTLMALRGAAQAGCTTVAVEDAHATHEKERLKQEADYYVTDYDELRLAFL